MKVELKRGRRGVMRRNQWFFRVVADNGKTLAHSETYNNRADALAAVASMRVALAHAELVTDD
jgi:uncharacterized protein YegP (UPF0339 family)